MTSAVKTANSNEAEHRRELATAINLLAQGRINTVGMFTIAAGTTSTTVPDAAAHAGSVPLIIPTQATTLTPYVSARALGSFTLTHAAPASDTTYLYVLLG